MCIHILLLSEIANQFSTFKYICLFFYSKCFAFAFAFSFASSGCLNIWKILIKYLFYRYPYINTWLSTRVVESVVIAARYGCFDKVLVTTFVLLK